MGKWAVTSEKANSKKNYFRVTLITVDQWLSMPFKKMEILTMFKNMKIVKFAFFIFYNEF